MSDLTLNLSVSFSQRYFEQQKSDVQATMSSARSRWRHSYLLFLTRLHTQSLQYFHTRLLHPHKEHFFQLFTFERVASE
jgi:hypothetical protein